MDNNDIIIGGRAAYTVEETRLAMEWREKVQALEAKYKNELAEAGDDKNRRRAIIKLISDEVGPVPLPVKLTMHTPIMSELIKFQEDVKKNENMSVLYPDGSWDCTVCGNKGNTVKFCPVCGAKKPEAWKCPMCEADGNTGRFCMSCGYKRADQ